MFLLVPTISNRSIGEQNLYPNRTITSSRSIYELVRLRLMAARASSALANRTRQNGNGLMPSSNYTIMSQDGSYRDGSKNKLVYSKETHDRLLSERLRVSFVIGGISVLFVTIICIICIVSRRSSRRIPMVIMARPVRSPDHNPTPESMPFSQTRFDQRNFQRKERRWSIVICRCFIGFRRPLLLYCDNGSIVLFLSHENKLFNYKSLHLSSSSSQRYRSMVWLIQRK